MKSGSLRTTQQKETRCYNLSPRIVPANGNSFWTCISLAIFSKHDMHQSVRENVQQLYSRKVFGVPIKKLCQCRKDHSDYPIPIEGFDKLESVIRWKETTVIPASGNPNIDINLSQPKCVSLLAGHILTCLVVGYRTDIYEMAPLVVELWGVVVVLYDANDLDIKNTASEYWRPSRTWYPSNYKKPSKHKGRSLSAAAPTTPQKHIHLLLRSGTTVELLVKPNHFQTTIPTRVYSKLDASAALRSYSKQELKQLLADSIFQLNVFDSNKGDNFQVGPFIVPTGTNIIHWIDIDCRTCLPTYTFIINGCNEQKHPVYIYSTCKKNGQCYATMICHWDVDYMNPTVFMKTYEDGILVVLADNLDAANKAVIHEKKCRLIDKRVFVN